VNQQARQVDSYSQSTMPSSRYSTKVLSDCTLPVHRYNNRTNP